MYEICSKYTVYLGWEFRAYTPVVGPGAYPGGRGGKFPPYETQPKGGGAAPLLFFLLM